MSTRRSGRAKAHVKYTSDSEGSEFGGKRTKKSPSKAQLKSTPKKRTKAEQDAATTDATPKKRAKRDPETLAAEHAAKAKVQEERAAKQQHKKKWEDWLADNNINGKLLDAEPAKEESITQTDSQKQYGLKPTDLGSLKHAEKRHPIYNNTTKLFVEEEVKTLAFRKYGMLAGAEGDESELLKKGEEVWAEEHKNDPPTTKQEPTPQKSGTATTPKKAGSTTTKAKTPKQKWTAYVETHSIAANDKLDEEPEQAVNQTDSKTKYSLTPADLAVLPYFPKRNPKYGNTTKLFNEDEVKSLAYRKAAYLGGVEGGDEVTVLKQGKELFEDQEEEDEEE